MHTCKGINIYIHIYLNIGIKFHIYLSIDREEEGDDDDMVPTGAVDENGLQIMVRRAEYNKQMSDKKKRKGKKRDRGKFFY